MKIASASQCSRLQLTRLAKGLWTHCEYFWSSAGPGSRGTSPSGWALFRPVEKRSLHWTASDPHHRLSNEVEARAAYLFWQEDDIWSLHSIQPSSWPHQSLCLLQTAAGHQPARGLWHQPCERTRKRNKQKNVNSDSVKLRYTDTSLQLNILLGKAGSRYYVKTTGNIPWIKHRSRHRSLSTQQDNIVNSICMEQGSHEDLYS